MSPVPRILLVVGLLALPALGAGAPRERAAAPHPARVELPGKPAGAISLDYRVAAEPSIGVPLEITLTARVAGEVGRLTLDASATQPSAVLLTAPTLVASDAGVYVWRITVVPLAADAGYLSVVVAGVVDGVEQARSVSIALHGAVPPPAAQPAAGETLIALPVREGP